MTALLPVQSEKNVRGSSPFPLGWENLEDVMVRVLCACESLSALPDGAEGASTLENEEQRDRIRSSSLRLLRSGSDLE